MYGKNAVASPDYSVTGSLMVHGDPWYTIQGEGPDAGTPAVFVRLAGCNLRCFFCDTEFEGGRQWELEELTTFCADLVKDVPSCELVVLTGGEPLLQNVVPLMRRLNLLDFRVAIETAGTVIPPGFKRFWLEEGGHGTNSIVCSPKTRKINDELAPLIDAFKYIVEDGATGDDGLPNFSTQTHSSLRSRPVVSLYRPDRAFGQRIYVQAMDAAGNPNATQRNLIHAAEMAMKHGYLWSVQTHKLADLP